MVISSCKGTTFFTDYLFEGLKKTYQAIKMIFNSKENVPLFNSNYYEKKLHFHSDFIYAEHLECC